MELDAARLGGAARELIATALKKSPGDASVLASRAEVEVLAGDAPAARAAVAAARDAARANPFALLDDYLDALERELAVRDTAA